ncbi:MAG: hypothetical protein RRB22_11575 [Gammaproteobacteria bacterium]|nr:hypothetical protein [Gammaproteobacteria bacterium]
MTTDKHVYLLFTLLLLSGCLSGCAPGDSTELPAERPHGSISGYAVNGLIGGAQVSVYGFSNGVRGSRLGGTTTDASGAYSVDVQGRSQPVLIEVSGGSYVEEASGATVSLQDGQRLRAIGRYTSGQAQDLMVTPLTHMATALAEYRIQQGTPAETAIDEASATVNRFFAINAGLTRPIDISADHTGNNNPATGPDDDLLYGFYLAGLSHWSLWASRENQEGQPHATYNSIALSQIIYNDLHADGLLNGIGYNQAGTALERLGFGIVPLNEDAYRLAFSLHMLAVANCEENRTAVSVTELLNAAQQIAAQTTLLTGATDPLDIDNQVPTLNIVRPTGDYHSGDYAFQINVGAALVTNRIRMSIRTGTQIEEERDIPITNPCSVPVSIDTRNYNDGEHQINLSAIDALGNNATTSFAVQFDNTAPVVNVSSPAASNQPISRISGTYSDNIAGVQAIFAREIAATLLDDGTWYADIGIDPGENVIPLRVIDQAGNQNDALQTVLYLDQTLPLIDSSGTHSQARFSNGDGNYTELSLQDSNADAPLYFETDRLEMGGVLINRQDLDNNDIAYFGFGVSDQMTPTVATDPQDISVRVQYQRNDRVLNPWRPLTPVNGEYLVPLASETLAADWHQASALDEHRIEIEVTDLAGNQTRHHFTFRADFYVPATSMDNTMISDLGTDLFSTTDFAQRINLNNMPFASTAYQFTNTTGHAFYISVADTAVHTTTQTVDQLVREHRVQLKTTTEWRLGLMRVTDQCPDFDVNSDHWEYPDSVYNWTGSNWEKERVPAPSTASPESIASDTLPDASAPSDWTDIPDFDQQFKVTTIDNSPLFILTFGYDYILRSSFNPRAGNVFTWMYQDLITGTPTTCPSRRYFQQRETHRYESLAGYPVSVLSSVTLPNTPDFITTRYTVLDEDTGLEITPGSGWYRIPTGHAITVHKWVTTPDLMLHDDDVSDVANYTSYTPSLSDTRIDWSVDRGLEFAIVHDAGEGNIPLMPVRNIGVGQGVMDYAITR